MNKKESEVNYMNLDKNNIRSVNNILMFVYYGFLIVFFYQFFNSKKFKKSIKLFLALLFLVIFPFIMSKIQNFFYKIGNYLFRYLYKNVYVLNF